MLLLATVGHHAQPPERGQGEPLTHQRDQHHRERDEHDHVAPRQPGARIGLRGSLATWLAMRPTSMCRSTRTAPAQLRSAFVGKLMQGSRWSHDEAIEALRAQIASGKDLLDDIRAEASSLETQPSLYDSRPYDQWTGRNVAVLRGGFAASVLEQYEEISGGGARDIFSSWRVTRRELAARVAFLQGLLEELTGKAFSPPPAPPAPEDEPWPSTPRNAPCPCGSATKYKMCHGRP